MRPASQSGRGSNAEPKGRPIPGNVFDDRILRGPGCNRCLIACADHFDVDFLATAINVGAPTYVFEASRNLSVRCEISSWSGRSAASRQRLHPSPTTRREDHVVLIVQMSSDRLFLGRLLASIACLRFTGTINLPCFFQEPTQTGHFYFARMRTFLLCLDKSQKGQHFLIEE